MSAPRRVEVYVAVAGECELATALAEGVGALHRHADGAGRRLISKPRARIAPHPPEFPGLRFLLAVSAYAE